MLYDELIVFGRWDTKDVEVRDPGLARYIQINNMLAPHSGGRHEHKRFHKSQVHIVERLSNKLMNTPKKKKEGGKKSGSSNGKKIRTLKLVRTAFEIVELRTGKNPIEALVRAIEYTAPREETTRISYGGVVYPSAVDSAPQRRVDVALRLLAEAVRKQSFNNIKPTSLILAEELIWAANNDPRSHAVKKKQDIERVALSAR
ncbi:MAG: 30S ribosomal protein S7 [Candidatus Heimdallarchaeota archaeon]